MDLNIIGQFIHFLTDSSKKFSVRTMTFILTIITIWFVDNTFSFTYYYNIEKKLEHIEKVNSLIKSQPLAPGEWFYLNELKSNMIAHTTIKDDMYSILNYNAPKLVRDGVKLLTQGRHNHQQHERDRFWQYISSSYMFLVLIIIVPVALYQDKSFGAGSTILLSIAFILTLYYLGVLLAYLFTLIIPLWATHSYTYIANFLLSSLLWYAVIHISTRISNKKA